jgi:hypothetical protein
MYTGLVSHNHILLLHLRNVSTLPEHQQAVWQSQQQGVPTACTDIYIYTHIYIYIYITISQNDKSSIIYMESTIVRQDTACAEKW